jgi:HK97 family phage prohead protease
MEFKQLAHDIKALDTAKGVVEAYANVYGNVDSDEDMSMPGSFTKTVRDNFKRIRVLKNHYSTESLGVPLEMNASDPYGLFTVTQFNMKKDLSRDMFTDIQLAVDNQQNAELSIGYEVINSELVKLNNVQIRQIKEYKLYEYSFLSSWAANDLAITTGLKSMDNAKFMELLSKAYNLNYSDSRLIQIETLLKSLTNEPLEPSTPKVGPIEQLDILNHIQKSFSYHGN